MKIFNKLTVILAVLFVMVGPNLAATGARQADSGAQPEVTLTAFVQQSATSESGIWQGWGAKKLYDDLKIKIDFYPTNVEVEQKLQQYLAAGDLPDLIGFKALDQAQRAMDADTLLPLEQYADQLPSLFKSGYYDNALAYARDYRSNGAGHVFLAPTAVGPTGYNSFNWQPMLQWDVWKKAGRVVPKTLEDYLTIVEAMVKAKPTTPAGEKVYGFSLFSDWDKYSARQVSTLSFMYGIDTEYVSDLMETNVITKGISSILDDNSFYRRALTFYFNANQRGLLDPDSMTQTYANVDAKYSAGRVMFSHFSWLTGTYNAAASVHVNGNPPDGYAAVIADDMKLYVAPEQTIGRDWHFAVNKNTKRLNETLALLNWMYDPAVQAYLMNGPEGLIWETNSATKEPVMIEKPEVTVIFEKNSEPHVPANIGGGAFRDGMYAFNTTGLQAAVPTPNGYTLGYRYWPTYINRNPTQLRLEMNTLFGAKNIEEYVAPRGQKANSTLAVNMITPVSGDLEMIVVQIGEVVKKYSWQMVYAANQTQFNSLWNQMKTEANSLGLSRVNQYYTDQWNRALQLVSRYE
jgi:hypothetical protein